MTLSFNLALGSTIGEAVSAIQKTAADVHMPVIASFQGSAQAFQSSLIILLTGIVKKNGIVLVDLALTSERERGLSAEDAIHEACRLRFRPIRMTTLCALAAGVSLMLGTGAGSEIRQPLGYAIVGGLLVSESLTPFTTPVVYIYMDLLSGWLNGRRDRSRAEGVVHAA